MTTTLLRAAIGMIGFMVLDGIWLGVLMKDVYRDQLAPIARLVDGRFAPLWSAALVVYVALGAGLGVLVVPRASSLATAAGYGAFFGLVVYGVYDFTNYSTLRQWPFALALMDVAWGATASAICAAVIWMATR